MCSCGPIGGGERPVTKDWRRRGALIALVSVTALGAGLRVTGLRFGEGFLAARPDENIAVGVAGIMPTVDLPPTLFFFGGGYLYPLWAFLRVWAWPDSIAAQTHSDPFSLYVAARSWSALLSTLTIVLTYAAGASLAGRRTGLVAAALLATSTLAI